jgi:hypothetical protein
MIGRCQFWGQQSDRREADGPLGEHIEHHRIGPYDAGGFDTTICRALREMKYSETIREQRGAALSEVETPLVQYREVSDEGSRRLTLALCQHGYLRQKFLIGKSACLG